MKKYVCLLLMLLFCCSLFSATAENKEFTFSAVSTKSSKNVKGSGEGFVINAGGYVCFPGVDLTGVASVHVEATWNGGNNGDAIACRLDSPNVGTLLCYIVVNDEEKTTFSASVETPVVGVHDLYLYSSYNADYVTIKKVTLSSEPYIHPIKPKVPDTAIFDNGHDTYVATDALGRAVADYAEAGDIKEGEHEVGMMYWDWHTPVWSTPAIISDILSQYPEAKDDYYHKAWSGSPTAYTLFWDEPLLGFYGSFDYWVYRRHTEMLANAGVDAIFFDTTNADYFFLKAFKVLAAAFRDSKADGVDIPRVSAFTTNYYNYAIPQVKAIYLNCFVDEDYSDIWYFRDGKPFLLGEAFNALRSSTLTSEDQYLAEKCLAFFSVRDHAHDWTWLEDYPQKLRGTRDGRVEFISVGNARNSSYVASGTWAFGDPYAKGRSYTEAFGEDYRKEAKNQGYFMKEQISRVLEQDPTFVFINGWNEFKTNRQNNYRDLFANGFIDLFDEENSRDLEPVSGDLRDDYYNLTVDFIRKYKGVSKPPVASEKTTIDIQGDASQWETVAPTFLTDRITYQRSSTGYGALLYTTRVVNAVEKAKVARDDHDYYFYAQTLKDIEIQNGKSLHLYLNTDRNRATGWEGYDYAVNLTGMGVLSHALDTDFHWETVANVDYTVQGNILQMRIPTDAIGSPSVANLEFKWADNAEEEGDILRFYQYGAVAPLGRFNFLYTEIEPTTLSAAERKALKGVTVLREGGHEMTVSGARMKVYEGDVRITSRRLNESLYLPITAYEDILGYGMTKAYDYAEDAMVLIKTHGIEGDVLVDDTFVYTALGDFSAHVNGRPVVLSAPTFEENGVIYLPISMLKECFGYTIREEGGAIVVYKGAPPDAQALSAAIRQLN